MDSKVLILYTGGTIGMIEDPESGQLSNVNFDHIYDQVPELKQLNIQIETQSFENPIDSSDFTVEQWQEIAQIIHDNYNDFDGFVVLHGSDTMAFSASALSFMFDGLTKPIIFTGSQLPIGVIRTDGKENLITAIEIAAAKDKNGDSMVQEVAVYFEYKLYRGNRSTKDSAENFQAFRSPNYRDLAEAGVQIRYNKEGLYRSKNPFALNKELNRRIALLKMYPGINFGLHKGLFDKENVDGLVIETYGSGNARSSETLKQLIKSFVAQGGIVLNITQCNSGAVKQGLYRTSSMFNELGVISGHDLTTEAAVTKLMSVLANGDNPKEDLGRNLRGEMTID